MQPRNPALYNRLSSFVKIFRCIKQLSFFGLSTLILSLIESRAVRVRDIV